MIDIKELRRVAEHGTDTEYENTFWADAKNVISLLDHIEQQEAEIARLRKDAARWNWAKHKASIQCIIEERYGCSDTVQDQDNVVDQWIEIEKARASD